MEKHRHREESKEIGREAMQIEMEPKEKIMQ
jgi:hypothetical protein